MSTPTPDIDIWTTTQGRWRLQVDEWLRRRSAPPEALSVDGRPSGVVPPIDPPRPDEPCPDEIAGDAATAGVTIPTDATTMDETLQ